ncbi:Na-dependent transporter, partial [candidate division MSBL1 archaeon SCGC-AAA382A03]
MYLVLIAALIAGFYVGWNIGSNDAANAMGVPVGGRIISYRRAVTIMILFVILGAVLEGWKVMETVGQGIVVS